MSLDWSSHQLSLVHRTDDPSVQSLHPLNHILATFFVRWTYSPLIFQSLASYPWNRRLGMLASVMFIVPGIKLMTSARCKSGKLDSYEAIYKVVSEAIVPWREYIVETLSRAKAQKASQSSLIRKSGSKDSLYHVNNFILVFSLV